MINSYNLLNLNMQKKFYSKKEEKENYLIRTVPVDKCKGKNKFENHPFISINKILMEKKFTNGC